MRHLNCGTFPVPPDMLGRIDFLLAHLRADPEVLDATYNAETQTITIVVRPAVLGRIPITVSAS